MSIVEAPQAPPQARYLELRAETVAPARQFGDPAMTITVRPALGLKATRMPSKSCKWLGEAIVNGRDGEHAPDSGHSRDRDGTAGFDPFSVIQRCSAYGSSCP